jgi:hypothetical protein
MSTDDEEEEEDQDEGQSHIKFAVFFSSVLTLPLLIENSNQKKRTRSGKTY